jgi:hypothetical protein
MDGDIIYLMAAHFVNVADGTLATLTVNAADSTVTLTVKPDANIPDAGHLFEIIYDIKDNGLPVARCATGLLKVQVYKSAVANDIVINDTTICYGTTASLNLSTNNVSIPNPVYKWYASQMITEPFHTGNSYTTSSLIVDSTFYIGISGTDYCENATGERKAVKVILTTVSLSSMIMLNDTSICAGTSATLTPVVTGITNPVYRWYASQTATTPFHIGASYTTSVLAADTTFYVSVSGDSYCENVAGDRKEVNVSLLNPSTQGKDFYVSFGSNCGYVVSNVTLQIRIVAQKATTVDFTYKDNPTLDTSFAIAAGSVYTHDLTLDEKTAVYSNVTGVNDKSLRIQSTEKISVYALNQAYRTTDATFVLPVDVLGTEYFHLSHFPYNQPNNYSDGYTIIATEDNTEIYENNTLKTTLNSGQVYSAYYYANDITGYFIKSSNPVAYFVTNQIIEITKGIGSGDNLYEQMTPVNTWGKTFVVPVTKRGVERIRIVASQDGTKITQTGGVIITGTGGQSSPNLNRGQFVELEIKLATNGCYISSNKPIGVASYLVSMNYSGLTYGKGLVGDPALTIVPPIEQMIFSADIAPFIPSGATSLNEHYVMIITPTATRTQTTVSIGNGIAGALTGGSWTTGNGLGADYSFYSVPLTNQTAAYHFANSNGLMAMGFGLGQYESYYYLSGAGMQTLDAAFFVNDIHYLDLDGDTLCVGNQVTFHADGINPPTEINGYLKWYINEIEQTAYEDVLRWNTPLTNGEYTVRIDVVDKCRTYSFETSFTVFHNATADSITIQDTTTCYGTTATLTSEATTITNPVYNWYTSQEATDPFHTGATYTTSNLIVDTTFYIGVSGMGVCENSIKERKAVTVRVNPLPTFALVADTMTCAIINLAGLISNVSVNAVVRFYSDAQGNNLLSSSIVYILSDTQYYVRATDTVTGCISAIETIDVHQGTYPAESPITGKHVICIDETVTLSNAATEGGVWSISNPSIGEIVSQTSNSVEVKGKIAGNVYVSYTIGNVATCQTRITFGLKVIPPTIPEIIIGIERE